MNLLIDKKVIEHIDSLLCNLQNENRPVNKLRERLIKEIGKNDKYAIRPHGDIQFNELRTAIYGLGYRPINEQQGISRTNFNTIGIIAGNWMAWNDEFWEGIGHTVIDYKIFIENPKKYIHKHY